MAVDKLQDGFSQTNFKIYLALSGGGIRATVFHLGVLRFLKQAGHLARVSSICSVSGGSIAAGYVVQNWEAIAKGSDELFKQAAATLLRGAARYGIRERISLSLHNPTRRFSDLQKCYVRGLARNGKDCSLRDVPGSPDFYILGTDFATGRLVAFCRDGVRIYESLGDGSLGEIAKDDGGSQLNIWRAVACSSAFPPMFAPAVISPKEYWAGSGKNLVVGDGGVYDNLGIRLLGHLAEKEKSSVLFVVSDAGRPFCRVPASSSSFKWMMDRNVRANDIQFSRLAEADMLQFRASHLRPKRRLLSIQIGDTVNPPSPSDLPTKVQELASQVRTDLDTFSETEIHALIKHAWSVTRKNWQAEAALPPSEVATLDWLPCGREITEDKLLKGLKQSSARRWRAWAWPAARLVGKWMLIACLCAGVAFGWRPVYRLLAPPADSAAAFSTQEKTIRDFEPASVALRGFRRGLPLDSQDFVLNTTVPFPTQTITLQVSSDEQRVAVLRSWVFSERSSGLSQLSWTEKSTSPDAVHVGEWTAGTNLTVVFCVADATVEGLKATVVFQEK
jgi:predicted acylesterase/phospholipase RssA